MKRVKKIFIKYNIVLLLIGILLLITAFFQLSTHQKQAKPTPVISECIKDDQATIHYHVNLKILYLGTQYVLPDTIGFENGCLHPIQVHDGKSGDIHIHYTKTYPFTLGDFFTTWGIIFNKNQLGGTFIGDRYTISIKVNGRSNNSYENYILKDRDTIEITIANSH